MHFVNDNTQKRNPSIELYQSIGHRDEQQDRVVISQTEIGTLVAVADGHSGHIVVDKISTQLAIIFNQLLQIEIASTLRSLVPLLSTKQIKKVIKHTFKLLIKETQNDVSGSTLSLAFIEQGYSNDNTPYQEGCRVTIGQLGDSVIALSKKSGHLAMAPLHAVSSAVKDVAEIHRAYQEKYNSSCTHDENYIQCAQNSEGLAVTRSLGDAPFLLIRKPEVKSYFLPTKSIIMLASDGVLNKKELPRSLINKYIKQLHNSKSCEEVVSSMGWLDDNTTMLVVRN